MAITYVVLKLSRIFERGAEYAPPAGRGLQLFADEDGRLICIEVGTGNRRMICVGVYAPAIDDQCVKCSFLEELRGILITHCNQKTFICGDFNIKLGIHDSDKSTFRKSRATIKLCDILTRDLRGGALNAPTFSAEL